jgi:dienelactone hydrolase
VARLSDNQPTQSLTAGAIIERVTCQKDATQSYALYLPASYTPERRWPIIYAFDPGGRGAVPVRLFQEAAEKYGYIVAGSYNSRNGPDVPLNIIVPALWEDTHARLAIDDRRTYTTGFSGGARVAASVAYANAGRVAGVILNGAGFSPEMKISKNLTFVIYGLAGLEDFNYFELKELDRSLREAGVAHHLTTFDGQHSWPSAELCTGAVEWLELQAIKQGRVDSDEGFIDRLLAKHIAQVRDAEMANRIGAAASIYESLASDFRGLRDVSEFERKAASLKASQAFKSEEKREAKEEQSFRLRSTEFARLLQQASQPEEHVISIADARKQIAGVRKKVASGKTEDERREARRLLALFSVTLREQANIQRHNKNYRGLLDCLVLVDEARPDNPQTLYQLAAAYALNGNKKQTIEALKRAIEKGWNDAQEIARNPAFDLVRREPAYRQLVDSIPAKSK